MMPRIPVSSRYATEFLSRFRDQKITTVWFSDHRIMYMELGGKLSATRPENHPHHQQHIFPGYDWRILSGDEVVLRRTDPDSDKIAERLLVGETIAMLAVGDSNELIVSLGTGLVIESVSEDGQNPDWNVRDGRFEYLGVSDGEYEMEFVR